MKRLLGVLHHVRPLAWLALLTAVVVAAPLFGMRHPLTWVPASAASVVLLLSWLLAVRAKTRPRMPRVWFEVAILASLLLFAQLLLWQWDFGFDVSDSHDNTLSPRTIAAAEALGCEVVIHTLVEPRDRAATEVRALVDQLNTATHRSQPMHVVSDDEHASAGQPNMRAVCGERIASFRIDAGLKNHEIRLLEALRTLARDRIEKIYVTQGQGEPDLLDLGEHGFSQLREVLIKDGVSVTPWSFQQLPQLPDDADAFVIAAPTTINKSQLQLLGEAFDAGARVLVFADVRAPQLDGLMGRVGISRGTAVIEDESPLTSLSSVRDIATGQAYEAAHPITAPLGGTLTHFPSALPLFELPGPAAKVSALVTTGTAATSGATAGPFVVAMAAAQAGEHEARMVVFGDVDFATNRHIQLGHNQDVVQNAVHWLLHDAVMLEAQPHARRGALLLMTPSQRVRLAATLFYAIPLVALIALTLRRQRR